ncbi:MAG: HPr family phosphocarrier protein [Planctomycetota bacterium]
MTPDAPPPVPCRAVVRAPSPQGLHARPAARIVDVARRFGAETVLLVGAQTARAKDLLDVLALAAVGGTEVVLEGSGPDAADAVAALEALFARFHAEG